jgi:hypothetical protein
MSFSLLLLLLGSFSFLSHSTQIYTQAHILPSVLQTLKKGRTLSFHILVAMYIYRAILTISVPVSSFLILYS